MAWAMSMIMERARFVYLQADIAIAFEDEPPEVEILINGMAAVVTEELDGDKLDIHGGEGVLAQHETKRQARATRDQMGWN
jgi:hypothetical protein